jgi:transposase
MERIHNTLHARVRQADGRNAEPTAAPIDSQSVRSADAVSRATSGFDAGKKTRGGNRFIVTDTLGLLLAVHVMAASVQDRDGAKRSPLWTRLDHPSVQKAWPYEGFAGRLVTRAADILHRDLGIVRTPLGQRGFLVQPERWTVERTCAWITTRRRLACDYERGYDRPHASTPHPRRTSHPPRPPATPTHHHKGHDRRPHAAPRRLTAGPSRPRRRAASRGRRGPR